MKCRTGLPLAGLAFALLAGCGAAQDGGGAAREANGRSAPRPVAGTAAGAAVGMPNPASVFCRDQGGTTQLRKQTDSSVIGLCHFPDGRLCEEWSLFRSGACLPPR